MRINTPPEMPSDVRRPRSEVLRSEVRRPRSDVRRSTFDLRPSTFDLRPSTSSPNDSASGISGDTLLRSSSPSILRMKRDNGSRDATLYLTAHHAHRSENFLLSLCRDPACHARRAYSIECW